MTVAAPEKAIAARRTRRAPVARQARPRPLPPSQPRPGPPGPQGRPGRAAPATRSVRSRIPTTVAHRTNYQPVILMEFVAAMLLTAMSPFARKHQPQSGLSPYVGKDVVQLTALMVIYLILALMSLGGRSSGRIAAWFGGLILVTVGLAEGTSIAKTLSGFAIPANPAASSGVEATGTLPPGLGTTATPNATVPTPGSSGIEAGSTLIVP